MKIRAKGCDPDGSRPFFLAKREKMLAFVLPLDYIMSDAIVWNQTNSAAATKR
jgi:hypothetical protein